MSKQNQYDSLFWQALERNRLVDLSQFHRPHFFDEAPLFSRASDVSFLSKLPKTEANSAVLRFALKFLKSVISFEEHEAPFFAAITVSQFSTDAMLLPSLFVWSDPVVKLYERLILQNVKSPLGKRTQKVVDRLKLSDPHAVFEDTTRDRETQRVFVAPSLPPYPSFVPIYMFCKPALQAK